MIRLTLLCDECEYEYGGGTFGLDASVLRDNAEREGWVYRVVDDEYLDFCPRCAKEPQNAETAKEGDGG